MNIVSIGHNRLDFIVRQIRDGHELVTKGGKDWVAGTLLLANALREARDAHPANISFGAWLKQNELAFYNADDRTALINLAADPDLAREILSTTDSTSYQHIWRQHAARFRQVTKTSTSTPGRKRKHRTHLPGRKQLHYVMKLGAAAMERIKGTSLDRHDEKEELVRLNRGVALGELTQLVRQLIDDAAAGQDISAVAYTRSRALAPAPPLLPPGVTAINSPAHATHTRTRTRDLLPAWRKRMIAPWQLADFAERVAFIDYLVASLPRAQQDALVEHLVDNLHPTPPSSSGGSSHGE